VLFICAAKPFVQRDSALVDSAGDGNAGLAEDMGHLRVAQTGGVVFKGEMVFLLVDMKLAQSVGIGKLPEAAELLQAQGRL
jgi:hypothetical protein